MLVNGAFQLDILRAFQIRGGHIIWYNCYAEKAEAMIAVWLWVKIQLLAYSRGLYRLARSY